MQDRVKKTYRKTGRFRQYTPPLTDEQKERMRQLLLERRPDKEVADIMHCGLKTVGNYRRQWSIPPYNAEGYVRRSIHKNANICIDCKNACGDCPWSSWDERRNCAAFLPVPGWTVEEYVLNGVLHQRIIDCPMFEEG